MNALTIMVVMSLLLGIILVAMLIALALRPAAPRRSRPVRPMREASEEAPRRKTQSKPAPRGVRKRVISDLDKIKEQVNGDHE